MTLKHEKTKQTLHLLWYVLLWLHLNGYYILCWWVHHNFIQSHACGTETKIKSIILRRNHWFFIGIHVQVFDI
jgi:hypothetical protein